LLPKQVYTFESDLITYNTIQDKVKPFFRSQFANLSSEDKDQVEKLILVVTHSGVIHSLLETRGIDPETGRLYLKVHIPTCSMHSLTF